MEGAVKKLREIKAACDGECSGCVYEETCTHMDRLWHSMNALRNRPMYGMSDGELVDIGDDFELLASALGYYLVDKGGDVK